MSTIEKKSFGKMPDGQEVSLFRMTNEIGAIVEVTNYGGRLVRILVLDKNESLTSVIKGFDSLEGYLTDSTYLGAICGRFANRIAKARFFADGDEYTVDSNDGENCLHGGFNGLSSKVWDAFIDGESLVLSCLCKDKEGGFPGNLKIEVTYSWSETNELCIQINANTDKATPVNITNHAYFNLNGDGDILDHKLRINATRYIPIRPDALPTGEIRFVKDTALDFIQTKTIGQDINNKEEQIQNGTGYDHCFVLNKDEFGDLVMAADAFSSVSGICLRVYTTLPGIQFYSGNYLTSSLPGHEGTIYEARQAFCLEPEFFPDSPNQSGFPCCILQPKESFQHSIIFQFN